MTSLLILVPCLVNKAIDLIAADQLVCFYYVLTTFTTVGYGAS